MFSTELQEEKAVAVTSTNAIFSEDVLPGLVIHTDSGIEVAENDQLFSFWHSCHKGIEFFIELVLYMVWVGHGRCVGADDCGLFLSCECQFHGHYSVVDTLGEAAQFVHKLIPHCKANASFAAVVFGSPTPEERKACSSLLELSLLCRGGGGGGWGLWLDVPLIKWKVTCNTTTSPFQA